MNWPELQPKNGRSSDAPRKEDCWRLPTASMKIAGRNPDDWGFHDLLRKVGGRRIDDLPCPLPQTVAGTNLRLIATAVPHGERIIAGADAAQQVGEIDQMLGDEMGDAALTLVAAPHRHHAG